jgi:hypothetical protein
MSKNSIIVGVLLSPSAAAAHPEHFLGGHFGLAHYLSDPFHIALAGSAVLFFVAGWWFLQRRSAARARR